jgi:hypothetical protein
MSYSREELDHFTHLVAELVNQDTFQTLLENQPPEKQEKMVRAVAASYLAPYRNEGYGRRMLETDDEIGQGLHVALATIDVNTVTLVGKAVREYFASSETQI